MQTIENYSPSPELKWIEASAIYGNNLKVQRKEFDCFVMRINKEVKRLKIDDDVFIQGLHYFTDKSRAVKSQFNRDIIRSNDLNFVC